MVKTGIATKIQGQKFYQRNHQNSKYLLYLVVSLPLLSGKCESEECELGSMECIDDRSSAHSNMEVVFVVILQGNIASTGCICVTCVQEQWWRKSVRNWNCLYNNKSWEIHLKVEMHPELYHHISMLTHWPHTSSPRIMRIQLY